MRSTTKLVISVFLLALSLQLEAAGEWKNPDLEPAPPPVKKAAPATKPAARPVPKSSPPARPLPKLEGQLAIEVIRVCDYQKTYDDKGSGGKIDGAFYLPRVPEGYAIIGGYAQGNYHSPNGCMLAVKPADDKSISLLQIPAAWQRIWTDKGSGSKKDGAIWQASPQNDEYVCLGNIAQPGYQQPNIGNYVCVHQCLVEKTPGATRIWSSKGTGARETAYVYKLHNSGGFFTLGHNKRPAGLNDLRGDTRCLF